MKLIQELYSKEGRFRETYLEVETLQKADNVLIPHTKLNNVIWVNKKTYPILFRSSLLRDAEYDRIKEALQEGKQEHRIGLERFYNNLVEKPQLIKILVEDNYAMSRYLFGQSQIQMSKHNIDFKQLGTYDCFNSLSNQQLKKIQNKTQQIFTYEQIHTFSRSLQYPKKFHPICSPLFFWTALAEL